ncbi:MAG: glycosyltransferase [Anaerolineaceae bacterium]|nr:glycosyltransferase [Anaerolineaceae bacterium]
MDTSKVSIVIPVFNGGDYLQEAIESALAQTYKNVEILVINDGSDDSGATERIAMSYDDRVRYFSKPNGGVGSALNRAISEMTGDYFSWLSHDDLYTKDKVEKEINALSRIGRNDVVVYSDYSVFTSCPENAVPVNLKNVPPKHFRYWITVENRLHGCTLLIPRNAFEKVGGFNESLRTTQDYDLWFRMAKEFSFVHIPDVLVKARSHCDQGSHRMAGIALAECNELLSNFVRGLQPQEILSATSRPLAESYADIASSMFKRGFDETGILAEKFAKQTDIADNGIAALAKNMRHIGHRFFYEGKKFLPPKVKQMIKAAIHYIRKQTTSESAERQIQLKEKFSEVYEKNIFGGRVSRSGEGSDLVQTEIIRRELPKIIENYSIKTFLDAPCGDWYWMRDTNLGVEQYIGVDIVEAMIEKHKKSFGSPSRTFLCLNLATDALPKADLIFSRDCLVHLTFADALKIISNFKISGAKYLLTTTFVDRTKNNDLVGKDGFWRPLNLRLAPFNFPEPLLMVNEGCTEEAGQCTDKSLGLWLLSDIKILPRSMVAIDSDE